MGEKAAATASRVRIGILAFFATPVALIILYVSTAAAVLSAAQGIPLSAYGGAAGTLVAALILFLVSLTGVAEVTGMYVATAWSAVIAVGAPLVWRSASSQPQSQGAPNLATSLEGALMWSFLPVLVFFIFLGASISLTLVRRWRKANTSLGRPWAARGKTGRTGAASIGLGVSVTVGLWIVLAALAPADLATVSIFGAQGLIVEHPDLVAVLLACLLSLALGFSSAYSTLGVGFSAVVLMIFPGQILLPLWMTLTGQVAVPSSAVNTIFALVGPTVAAIGVVLLAATAPVHFARTRIVESEDPLSAPTPERLTENGTNPK